MALRNSLGVALALSAGAASGALSAGVVVATGALNVAFSDSDAAYAQRSRRMVASSVLVGFAVFAGAVCGNSGAIAVLIATLWAFAAGLLVALGQTVADLATLSLVVLVVYSAFPMPPERAMYSGLLACSGGLLQTLLAVALWPLRRFAPEQRAVGELYRTLARAAASPAQATAAPPATAESIAAHNALSSLDHSIEAARYRMLLNQAERIRLALLTLARLSKRIQREEPDCPAVNVLDRYLGLASHALNAIGNSLVAGQHSGESPEALRELQELSEQLRAIEAGHSPMLAAMLADARFQMEALSGQLRSALDLAEHATPAGLEAFEQRESRQPWRLRFGSVAATLRANISLRSAAFRHAIRLALCIGIGELIGRGLHWQRPYWLPMTIAIVLKPDFSATFSRGVLRALGTFVGLALTTALIHVLPSGVATEVTLVVILMFLMRWLGPANYGILVIAITGLVVLLIALAGVSPKGVIMARGANTLLGGAIALIAYWLWPTWERTQAPEALAQLLDTYREYFRAIREGYLHIDQPLTHELDRARLASRRARSNFEASIDRLSSEPGISPETLRTFHAILATAHRVAHALMALESGLFTSRPMSARATFRPFADHVELTLYYLASALRGSPLKRADLPDLREDHHALEQSGDPNTELYALVNVETDRITNSLNTLSEEVLDLGFKFQV